MIKKLLLAMLCLSIPFSSAFAAEKKRLDDYKFAEPYSYGNVLFNTNIVRCSYTIQDGEPIVLTVVPGTPTILNIVNLNTMKRIDAIEVPNAKSAAWMNEANKFGDVYFGTYTHAHLYKYSPKDKQLYDLGSIAGESALISMTFDDDGNPLLGTYPNCKIIKYDIETGKFIDFGRMNKVDQYLNAMAYYNKKCYYQTKNVNEGLYVYDIEKGTNTVIPFKENTIKTASKIMVRDNQLVFVATSTKNKSVIMTYDLVKGEWGEMFGENVKGQYVTPVLDGKLYYSDSGYAYSYDINTKTHQKLEDMPFGYYLRGDGFVELNNPEMPGKNYVNIVYYGIIQLVNFETRKVKNYSDLLVGTPSETRDYQFGPDGRLYVGEYMGTKAAALNLETGEIELFHMSQPEGICTIGDKMYFGNYTQAELYILDTNKKLYRNSAPNDPDNNPRIWGSIGEHQDRPFCLINAGGKLAMGSVPDYGYFGGALTIYDPETDKANVMRNIVKDQMIVSIAYKDGKLYCGTSVSGGLGIEPKETDAKVFIFDMEENKIEKIIDLKIPGINSPIKGVEGISIAPDNTIVGYGRNYIYKLDINTLELLNYKIFDGQSYGNGMQIWKPYTVAYDKYGNAFISLNGKLAILNPETLDYRLTDFSVPYSFKMGPDGNIYYIGDGYKVMMLPVIEGDDYSYKFKGKTIIKAGSNKCIKNGRYGKIDDNESVVAYEEKDKIMVPLRFLAESFGYSVTYNSLEKTAVLYNKDKDKIKVSAHKGFVTKNGEAVPLAAAPEEKDNRLFVHIRTFGELFGKNVYWDESGTIVINNDGTLYNPKDDAEVLKYALEYFGG